MLKLQRDKMTADAYPRTKYSTIYTTEQYYAISILQSTSYKSYHISTAARWTVNAANFEANTNSRYLIEKVPSMDSWLK